MARPRSATDRAQINFTVAPDLFRAFLAELQRRGLLEHGARTLILRKWFREGVGRLQRDEELAP